MSGRIHVDWSDCFECPLALRRKKVVRARGGFKRKVMFIGEAPGENEEKRGLAFVGKSGELLDIWIKALGLTEDDVYITNVVKCRPPKNRDPTDFEIEGCLPHLSREIRELEPLIVVPLGRFATKVVSHMREEGIVSDAQYALSLKHPAFYLYKGDIGHVPSDRLDFIKGKLRRREDSCDKE